MRIGIRSGPLPDQPKEGKRGSTPLSVGRAYMISSRLIETAVATASCFSLYSAPIIMKFLFLKVGFTTTTTNYKESDKNIDQSY